MLLLRKRHAAKYYWRQDVMDLEYQQTLRGITGDQRCYLFDA